MKGELRKENICLNCGATVTGRYCSKCGQENRDPRESFGELLYHFFSDFTHFDSKLFSTIKYPLFRPGFLTTQYLAGKRMSYLHPIRMYIFISFLYFFSMGLIRNHDKEKITIGNSKNALTAVDIQEAIDSIRAHTNSTEMQPELQRIIKLKEYLNRSSLYYTSAEFDSIQQSLPMKERLSGLDRLITRQSIQWRNTYGNHSGEMLLEKIRHDVPKLMFFLLPLFALFLKWFYRKKYLYTDHAIFSLHFHSFVFLLWFIAMLLKVLLHISFLSNIELLISFIYLVIALRNRYKQSWFKSTVKSILVSMLYGFSIGVGFLAILLIIFVTV